MSLLDEYLDQDKWRNWDSMLERLPFNKDHNILDLGCGPGLVSARLAERYKSTLGIDYNIELLNAAKSHCPENCSFIKTDLTALNDTKISRVNGIWSSFTSAYFPDFLPVLKQWTSCLSRGGWIALVETDGLFSGHHPFPKETLDAMLEYEEHLRSSRKYDANMGRRLPEMCRNAGLKIISEYSWEDRELAFDGIASVEVLEAWKQRFERMPGMKDYFGPEKHHQVCKEFLETISSPDHKSTARVCMVIAEQAR